MKRFEILPGVGRIAGRLLSARRLSSHWPRRTDGLLLSVFLLLGSVVCWGEKEQPNVLFIAVDDLNDWVGHLGGHPDARTPNIDRLARRGVTFSRAYCSAPLCNPSRVSLLTGIQPFRSGVYGNGERLRDHLPDALTLMQYLKAHGYRTMGGGKIFHGANRSGDPASWDVYFQVESGRVRPRPKRDEGLAKDAWAPWGPADFDDAAMFDSRVVDWTISQLETAQNDPFFLACGFTKPHLPWVVPESYFEAFPLDEVTLPEVKVDDLNDVPAWGRKLAREVYDPSGDRDFATKGGDHHHVVAHRQWRRAVQSYLATISYVDRHVGRLLDALDRSRHAQNTIVVLWGDHGWHLGQKQHWRKHALWEVTTRTPLMIAAPAGVNQNEICTRPVSLIDLYPTLVELCGLPMPGHLDGRSLVPLLRETEREWAYPVLTTFGAGNHAIRTQRWRLIHYRDGTEELYDHDQDPLEWRNLATDSKFRETLARLRASLPSAPASETN